MPYEFTTVINTFKQAHAALANAADGAKTAHDRKVYAAIGKPYAEVKKFYQEFETFLNAAKVQCKSNMDAIVAKYNGAKGKPDAAALKLMHTSLEIIKGCQAGLADYQKSLKTDLMDWRGVWDKACADVVFEKTALKAILAYRKSVIDKQAGEWNSTIARLEQYVTRAEALLTAAEKAAKSAPTSDGSDTLAKIKDAHTKAMSTGVKGVSTYILNVDNNYDKFKTEAKKGLDARDKPNAKKLWPNREAQFAQYAGYRKDFSGASKTLTMLTKLVANGIKGVPKDQQGEWKKAAVAIKQDLSSLEGALKKLPDMMKNMDTIKKHYQDAIDGK